MYLLALETTGPKASAALAELDTGDAAVRETEEPMGHLRSLMPLVEMLFRETGAEKKDIAAVAASAGPGSFTGIRIGVSTARALAQGWRVPCVKVGTLEQFRLCSASEPCAVILNARRGQVYGAVYAKGGETILSPGPYLLGDVVRKVQEAGIDPLWYGDGVDAYRDHEKYGSLLSGARAAGKDVRCQSAALTAACGIARFRAGETTSPDGLLPEYMRKTEAEQKLADGSLARARARKMARFRSAL